MLLVLMHSTSIQQTLQEEIEESKRALDGPIDDTIYRRDHAKRIELINWVLENMKKPNIRICDVSGMDANSSTVNNQKAKYF